MLSIAGKIFARVLACRLSPIAVEALPESQCGFRPAQGTVDMIFSARQIQEKCREQHKDRYMAFIDMTKAVLHLTSEKLPRGIDMQLRIDGINYPRDYT